MSIARKPAQAPVRRRFAAALLALAAGMAPAAAADRPAVEVDLGVLETLGIPSRPLPPLPPRRIARPAAETPAATPRTPVPPAATAPEAPQRAVSAPRLAANPPFDWRRPIPVTTGTAPPMPRPDRPAPVDETVGPAVERSPAGIEEMVIEGTPLPGGDGYRIVYADATARLTLTGQRLLDLVAERMTAQPGLRLTVLAYAGGTPESAARPRQLSLNRALAVHGRLSQRGIPDHRIEMRALGNTAPDGPTERVDLLLTD